MRGALSGLLALAALAGALGCEARPEVRPGGQAPAKAPSAASAKGTRPLQDDASAAIAQVARIDELLARVRDLRVPDDEAEESLEEAARAGAGRRERALAAITRGEALLSKGERERAQAFFEWARAHDERQTRASFALARMAAERGDGGEAAALLREVKARGGVRLLLTVREDPAFARVLEDPAVAALSP